MKIPKLISSLLPAKYGRLWRAWDFVRYDIPNFLRNTWVFRAELTRTFDWDAMTSLRLMKAHLGRVADYLEKNGLLVEDSRFKKVEKIRRAIALMDLHLEERFIDWAEEDLEEKLVDRGIYFEKQEDGDYSVMKDRLTDSERDHNGRIYARAQEIATETWMELFEIIRGQDLRAYTVLVDLYRDDYRMQSNLWGDWFNGSGLKHWWD